MADYEPTYANSTDTETLTGELNTEDSAARYASIMLIAYKDSDNTIISAFHKSNLDTPASDAELEQIGTLLAASFLFNDFYSDETELSGKGKLYKDEATRRLDEYIDYQLGLNSEDNEDLYPAATYSIEFD